MGGADQGQQGRQIPDLVPSFRFLRSLPSLLSFTSLLLRSAAQAPADGRIGAGPQRHLATPEEWIETARRFFDRAVRRNEEASVAAHSLGDPRLLAQATREIVELLDRWGVLGADRRTLEIGCGIGRLQAALAPRV